jgi:beta-glucosidase
MTDNSFNLTGLEWNMATRGGSFYVGYPVDQQWIANGIKIAQDYLMKNTTLGIPALVQSEGIHGFLIGKAYPFPNEILCFDCHRADISSGNATIFNSPSLALGILIWFRK